MRKTLIICLIFCFSLISVMAQEGEGEEDDGVYELPPIEGTGVDTIYGIVTIDQSIVRVGPDFAYDAIGSLALNASVVIVGRSGDFISRWDGRQWLQLETGGWIYARLVRTSIPFNSIPPTGRLLPRDRNGRVPDGFDLSSEVCSQWTGSFTQSGNFMAGDAEMVVTYPTLQGATIYSVIVIAPDGFRTPFDSYTGTATIELDRLPNQGGTYTWRVAPYWTNQDSRYYWQQICLLATGGTFEKPETGYDRAGSIHDDEEDGGD